MVDLFFLNIIVAIFTINSIWLYQSRIFYGNIALHATRLEHCLAWMLKYDNNARAADGHYHYRVKVCACAQSPPHLLVRVQSLQRGIRNNRKTLLIAPNDPKTVILNVYIANNWAFNGLVCVQNVNWRIFFVINTMPLLSYPLAHMIYKPTSHLDAGNL
jgi:hypothetical protein